jgi:hypothetical protein
MPLFGNQYIALYLTFMNTIRYAYMSIESLINKFVLEEIKFYFV